MPCRLLWFIGASLNRGWWLLPSFRSWWWHQTVLISCTVLEAQTQFKCAEHKFLPTDQSPQESLSLKKKKKTGSLYVALGCLGTHYVEQIVLELTDCCPPCLSPKCWNPCLAPPCVLRSDLLLGSGICLLGYAGWPVSSRDLTFCLISSGIKNIYYHTWISIWVLGMEFRSSGLYDKHFNQLSCLSCTSLF